MTIVELRQYTLHPGRRDELVELFEREFVESQDAVGARVVGTFRDLGAPDRFVWLREFADMAARRDALTAFYGGPVWAAHRDAANATMIEFDDVLLLEPVAGEFRGAARPPVGAGRPGPSRVLLEVRAAGSDVEESASAVVLRTAPHANDFPALPIRDEQVVVRLTAHDTAADAAAARERLAPGALQVAELEPTARSAFR
jgi:quinol monooxygenase YgiN